MRHPKFPPWMHPPWIRRPQWTRRKPRPERPPVVTSRRGDWLVRAATVLAVVAVAGVAAYISYWHAVTVVEHHGETGITGHLYPVLIDGIVVAASMVVLDAARHLEDAPKLAWCLLGSGIAVTLAANVAYGLAFGFAGAAWASWPAFAFVGCFELLMMLVRAAARRAENVYPGTVSSAVPTTAEAAALASLRTTWAAGNPWSVNQLVTNFGVTRAVATRVHATVKAENNGHNPGGTTP